MILDPKFEPRLGLLEVGLTTTIDEDYICDKSIVSDNHFNYLQILHKLKRLKIFLYIFSLF